MLPKFARDVGDQVVNGTCDDNHSVLKCTKTETIYFSIRKIQSFAADSITEVRESYMLKLKIRRDYRTLLVTRG